MGGMFDSRRRRAGSGRTVMLTGPDRHWVLVRVRRRDRLWAAARSLTLDRQIARGEPADADRLRAVRAEVLVDPHTRDELAAAWQAVLDEAGRPPELRTSISSSRVPVPRGRVLAAADDIRGLITAL